MSSIGIKERGDICPMCNIVQIKLVPLYDNDHLHKNTMCCQKCKRAIKAQKEIVKINRADLPMGN